jgi:hypothetical protein
MVLANLFGAIVTFCDFRFIDPVGATTEPRPGAFELTYAIVGFTLIMVAGRACGGIAGSDPSLGARPARRPVPRGDDPLLRSP